MKRPLGCLSGVGFIAVLLTLLVAGGFVLAAGGRPFSPGALSDRPGDERLGGVASHAEIGGNCAACHTAPWSQATMAGRCTECHDALQDSNSHVTRFHNLLQGDRAPQPCRSCHPEHRGADALLTEVSATDFPHDATGYSLAAHETTSDGRPFTCDDCHTDDLTRFEVQACDDCHTQIDAATMAAHRADFGPACRDCHDGVDRYGEAFDHAATAFPLEGGHAGLGCAACHAARATADFAAAPVECAGCHREDDAHNGEFGTDCGGCHSPDDWENATFDHARTSFPLTGAHVMVACQDCHRGTYQGTPTACAACHDEPAYHAGLFEPGCDACHDTAAWRPARFDNPHTFPIDHGEGGASSCRTCHPDALQAYTCYGCHEHTPAGIQEEHAGEVQGDITDCVRCHQTGQEDEGERRGGD